ncbi:MAG TPA: LytTR family DNA-binding domain-containing protein [Saprospiraceae bacterium]|nr:LytTR family DNA-binding domain-containing protein [Saprospiraceae bacterium]HMQ82365.1 LytTR family DNA-binding domain-containing protein [Saprospiraceae bacterium]
MNCIIIEDQPPAQRILKKYIEDMGSLNLLATFPDAIQAMDFLKTQEVDLIFLDIHLPKISGIDFLKTMPNPPHVILTTAFPDYALESYEFNVVDYLLKPFAFQRFVKAVSKVPAKKMAEPTISSIDNVRKEMFIKSGYEHIKITIDDILYVKSDADYTELFLPQKKHLSAEPLRYWLENLDTHQFARIHKSYIVNISKIEKIVGNQLYLSDGTVIPIGRAYKEEFIQQFVK